MNKFAVLVLSDPQSKSEEALGKVLNALVFSNDLKNNGHEIQIFFQGTGTRWVNILEDEKHPGHGLYSAVKDKIAGASKACATVFGAKINSIPLLCEFDIPGIGGATSLVKYIHDGYSVVTF